jgi:predicted HAD superfamily Cof-like phosphohydrolase
MNLEEMARQFRAAFGVQNHSSKRSLQISLIDEEYAEFREAARHWLETGEGAAECLKEAGDLVYVTFQFCANEGWSLLQALLRIHISNMSKLGPDGRPVRREDGKILKSEHYKPPYLDDLVNSSEPAPY